MAASTLCQRWHRSAVRQILETVVTTINPDGSVNCAAMGVEWGEQRIVIKPFRGTRTLRNLRATAGRGRPPDRRHPPVQPGGARRPASADPSGGERRGRDPGGRLLVARGARRGDRRRRARARVSTAVVGGGAGREFLGFNRACHAVLEASILASRARMLDPAEIRAELRAAAGARGQDGRSARARGDGVRARRGRRPVMVRVEAPARLHLGMLAVADDGTRRFGGLGVAVEPPGGRARGGAGGRAVRRGRRRGARAGVRAALPRRAGARRRRASARRSRRSRRTSGSGRARSSRSPWPRRSPRCTGARSMRRHWPRPPGARRAPRWGCGRSRSAASWSRAACGATERPAPLLMRHAMPDEWRIVTRRPGRRAGALRARRGPGVRAARAVGRALGGDRAARAHVAAAGARRARRSRSSAAR